MVPDATQALELIRIVREDSGLPKHVRRKAAKLTHLATSKPDLALERLDELHKDLAPHLPLDAPTIDYARCISIEAFWQFNLEPAIRELFTSPADYQRAIEADPNPEDRLTRELGPGMIAPATHSWLIPVQRIIDLTGSQTRALLNSNQQPPYVVMVFSTTKMASVDLKVRKPRGIDAIPKRHTQWHPGNVPDERIDCDIPLLALERIEWKP